MKVVVSKLGTLTFSDGYYYLNQNREIFVIGRQLPKVSVAGSFNITLPENFDLWGGNAISRKIVTEMLAKGKEIAAKAAAKETANKKPVKKVRK